MKWKWPFERRLDWIRDAIGTIADAEKVELAFLERVKDDQRALIVAVSENAIVFAIALDKLLQHPKTVRIVLTAAEGVSWKDGTMQINVNQKFSVDYEAVDANGDSVRKPVSYSVTDSSRLVLTDHGDGTAEVSGAGEGSAGSAALALHLFNEDGSELFDSLSIETLEVVPPVLPAVSVHIVAGPVSDI